MTFLGTSNPEKGCFITLSLSAVIVEEASILPSDSWFKTSVYTNTHPTHFDPEVGDMYL
jgi:hypothetical protein